jgi:hypothetical protein
MGSLPCEDLGKLPFPGLRADLTAIMADRSRNGGQEKRSVPWQVLVALAAAAVFWRLRRQVPHRAKS